MKNKNYYLKPYKEVLEMLDSSVKGLSKEEAQKRLDAYGKNKLDTGKKKSKFLKFLGQFNDMMIIILLIAAIISGVISYYNNEPFTDSIVILAIVIINAFMGFIQELKADQSIEALKKMSTPTIKVRRDGKISHINVENLVVGDIILLEDGDYVPADARVIKANSLNVDESSLTGESISVIKTEDMLLKESDISEISNMVFTGTTITYGRGEAVVVKTGMNTILGNIASSLSKEEKQETPLQIKIKEISRIISIIIGIIIVFMFVVGVLKGNNLVETLMLSISLAVAAIPEGLPAVITITLSLGMNVLANKKAIIRKINSVETLGSTQIICSDKTGTITQNKMTVKSICYGNKIVEKFKSEHFINAMALCNNVIKDDEFIGDPTEIAIYRYLEDLKIDIEELKNKYERVNEVPFDSQRKMMSTINKIDNKKYVYTKGGLDSILDRCVGIEINNKVEPITMGHIDELKRIESNEAEKALRLLAFAYKEVDNNDEDVEDNLIFLGIVGMMDPPRELVKESIDECYRAGVTPIMITGDSLNTAISIAKEVGIINNKKEAIEGKELDKYSDDELTDIVKKYRVYARVSPEHKLRIVKAWQRNSKIVAMTGDGVNDAPAIKTANIGIGMGITGTDVSKNVSDVILADDCFNTIVSAIREGRRIYDNIRNVILYLLTGNIVEVLLVFTTMLFDIEVFLPIQLLYINLITDSIPAIALAFEKEDKNVMERDVRDAKKPFFTPFMIGKLIISSLFKAIVLLGIYVYSRNVYGPDVATSMLFLGLIITEMLFALSCKNIKKNVMNKNIFNNSKLNISLIGLTILQIIVFVTPIKNIFKIVDLSFINVIEIIIPCIILFIFNEANKKVIRKLFKD